MLDQHETEKLLTAAREAMSHAYSPYSGIQVGAALMDSDGGIHAGCNVENSSYSLTICAERNAAFQAVARGARGFKGMVVVSDTAEVQSPCGACRQVLWEFNPDLPIVFFSGGRTRTYLLSELLPQAFSLIEEEDTVDG
ncbi:MAG: cytidine deaminase [Firmicutes bacterium]|nr:cytidine deaminase [Bacillota bacterium]